MAKVWGRAPPQRRKKNAKSDDTTQAEINKLMAPPQVS
jgi:hypothetical protein